MEFLTVIDGIRTLINAITASGGAADANKIVATGTDGRLDQSLMPIGVAADTDTILASEALSAGDFVNIWLDSGTRKVRKADASNNRAANGFVLSAVSNGQNATVFCQGRNTAVSGMPPGGVVWLSATTPGAASITPPATTPGYIVQQLGFAPSATAILFEYDGYILIAS
ncbi:hypothetical protein IQ268_08440 [Oculatella sp. LEGE 06141]|uniref:hypothetical protein n=1 Tax=Oculatella sp. LEGE 06141 TaxID=1828648 RepID=UPI001882D0EE|nr:hypothetical protein [Oculatella sp. LEGE 06141]MBE9178585.1 hypothetical protein [Oculatella sp. LEGE 06141]